MYRLHAKATRFFSYTPPFPVENYFGDIDPRLSDTEKAELLLWIPATLVSRFLAQFPNLEPEKDELFSIGVLTVYETCSNPNYDVSKLGAICNVKCRTAMETYANGLHSVLKVCKTTRYENRNKGVKTPTCTVYKDTGRARSVTDDPTELVLLDACEALNYDITDLTTKQKRKLAETLDLI